MMLFLPNQHNTKKFGFEKIDTYLFLSKLGFPVLKSALLFPDETVSEETINRLFLYFNTEEVNIRYQYIRPCANPIKGGNRYPLNIDTLSTLQVKDTLLWVLEPTNRFNNQFGINLFFCGCECKIEMVGKGFDVSDLNRGHISPHQIICTDLPIRKGEYNEWWKFLHYSFQSNEEYQHSKQVRINKLTDMNLVVPHNMFNEEYQPISFEKLEELLFYVSLFHENVHYGSYCASCSIIDNKFIFWDLQTFHGKKYLWSIK